MTAPQDIDFAVVGAAQLVRVGEGSRGARRGPEQARVDVVPDGALVARHGRIVDVGPTREIAASYDLRRADVVDAAGMMVMPGLIDAHTHPLFSGLRYEEYAERLAGLEMGDAKKRGGGIWWTVEQTRKAGERELAGTLSRYFGEILRSGTTTAEVKSGYGQTTEEELKHLAIIDRAARETPLRVIPTLLGAHIVPHEHARAADYVEEILHDMLPRAAAQGVARFSDTTVNRDFTPDLARRVMEEGRRLGLPARVHADGDTDTDGWAAAASAGAASADHLTSTPAEKIARVGATDTAAVLLPAAELYYFWGRAPARDFIRANVPVAIATDFCSSIHAASLFGLLSLAAPWYRMAPEEVIAAVTVNAAYSLGVLDQVGTLDPGKYADLLVVDVRDYRQMIYDYGAPLRAVIAGGVLVGPDSKGTASP